MNHENTQNHRSLPSLPLPETPEVREYAGALQTAMSPITILVNRLPCYDELHEELVYLHRGQQWQVDVIVWDTYNETGDFSYKKFSDFGEAYWWARMTRKTFPKCNIVYGDVAEEDVRAFRATLRFNIADGPFTLRQILAYSG